ncbi:hypothetical protein J6590_058671 [Homalodisca vitripennis]|nr:hypothetical protein J6590_058671 [Homalodisca vitripennis]
MMQGAVALVILAPLISHLALCRRRPNILEENQSKTTLHILDDNIVEYLSKPSENSRQQIFSEIVSYNTHFAEIINGFKERKFRYVRIAHVIYDKGGPNFMKLRVDGPMLLKINGWTMNDMGELYHHLKATHRLWLDFKKIYEEVKTAVKGNWTQLKSTFHSTLSPDVRLNITAIFQGGDEQTEFNVTQVTSIQSTNNTLV